MLSTLIRPVMAGIGLAFASQAYADGAAVAAEQCAGCHALEAPDYAALGVVERLNRKAPPLYFSGNKYRPGWLAEWLQAPVSNYPAGYFPTAAAIQSTPEGDVPDPAKQHSHAALDAATAAEVADYLMTLRPHDNLIAAVEYTPGKVAQRMGSMDFRKFKGCDSCHQDEAGKGGLSGPLLHNGWQRLQAEFMVSFIADPYLWDPNTIMPRMDMNAPAVNKLVDYLKLIGGEE